MSKLKGFIQKYNFFKLWPPFIRAYRQSATGQELTIQQRNYLKWGSILLVALFAVAWFIFYLPFLVHQAGTSLFTYTGSFVQPFFDASSAPRVSEFLWRFVAQFYLNVPLICLIVAFLVIGFCITSRKTVGPYTPFLLPLFFLLFPSSDPAQASIAISLWLIMGALAFYFVLSRWAARHPRALGPLIAMHLYGAVVSALLYYVTGHWALMFGIAVSFVHLIGIPMSLSDKREGLFSLRLWNFGLTAAAMLATGLVFWSRASYSPFNAPWYVWAALVVYALACLPGLVLQAYNNRKVYLYEWKKRKGEVQDGKPALSSPYHVLLSLIAIVLGFVLFFFSRNSDSRSLMRMENALEAGNYAKSLSICRSYFHSGGPGKTAALFQSREEEAFAASRQARMEAGYKFSLLMEGRLNQDYLALSGGASSFSGATSFGNDSSFASVSSRPVSSTDRPSSTDGRALTDCPTPTAQSSKPAFPGALFPEPDPRMRADDYIYIALCQAAGLEQGALSLVLSAIEREGLQTRYMEPLLASSLEMQQYDLFRNTLYYARKTLSENNLYHYYRGVSKNLLLSYRPDSMPVLKADNPDVLAVGGFIDRWVVETFEQQVFGGRLVFGQDKIYIDRSSSRGKPVRRVLLPGQDLNEPANAALLEYYAFLRLMERRIELVPYLLQAYRLCGFEALPAYLQEALCLYAEHSGENPAGERGKKLFSGFSADPAAEERVEAARNGSPSAEASYAAYYYGRQE